MQHDSVPRQPIALAGFMGVGKSTVGRALAERLELPFFDTDVCVESRGRRIDDFFLAGQEADFRRLEAAVVAELLGRGPSVIALGGGALLDGVSRALLRERSRLVHLHVPWGELKPHVPAMMATRPLLRDRTLGDVYRLYRARMRVYRAAPLRVTVSRTSPDDAVSAVLLALQNPPSPLRGGSGRGSSNRSGSALRNPLPDV